MNKVLSSIIENKKRRLEVLRKNREGFLSLIKKAPKPKSFKQYIHREGKISLIGELKQASPSCGILRKDFDLRQLAELFIAAKVNALSILTEEDFFLGRINYVEELSKLLTIPILRKDFIFDEIQVLESRAAGADAILLIVRLLDNEKLSSLYSLAKDLGMDVLVEIHSIKELKRLMKLPVDIIGINNRNLDTLKVELSITEKIIPFVSKQATIVSESGIKSLKDILWLKGLGVNAVLVGECIMRTPDVGEKIRELHIDA